MRFYQVSLWYSLPDWGKYREPDTDDAPNYTATIQADSEASAIDIASRCLLLEQYRRNPWVGTATPTTPDPLNVYRPAALPEAQDVQRSMYRRLQIARRHLSAYGYRSDLALESEITTCEKMIQQIRQGYHV